MANKRGRPPLASDDEVVRIEFEVPRKILERFDLWIRTNTGFRSRAEALRHYIMNCIGS